MNTLKLDLGVKEFKVTDDFSLFFNPADNNFVRRLFETFEEVEKIHDERFAQAKKSEADRVKMFDVLAQAERDVRAKIDDLFQGAPACEHIFHHDAAGDLSVFAAGDGLPLWVNLFFLLLDNIDAAYVKEQKATNPRMKAILAKYEKRKNRK